MRSDRSSHRNGRALTGLLAAGGSTILLLGLAEGFFRWKEHDFSGAIARHLETPVYFRKPHVPIGEVYHRREGPQEWTGNCMSTRLAQLGIVPDPYASDPPITVRYDKDGLRNPPSLTDWEITVVGDSFTELGHLPDEALFTTLLADQLNTRVKNVGMANSGPLTELCLLENFGIAPSTKQVAVIFFGGNDRQDVRAEARFLRELRETGKRFRMPHPEAQSSLTKALYRFVADPESRQTEREPRDFTHAFFESSGGRLPLSFHHAPPIDLEPDVLASIDRAMIEAFDQYGAFFEDKQLAVTFFYMPCKLRVYYDLVEYTELAKGRFDTWEPFDLPGQVKGLCEERGFGFVDLTPAMMHAAREDRAFLFNSIYDTHLNAEGARVVATELARHLKQAL